MIRLIKDELVKIFKKKSIYIAFIIVLLAVIGINWTNQYARRERAESYANQIASMKEYLKKYNPDNQSDISTYISIKSSIDELELMEKYGANSWQANVISEELGEILNEMNTYQYGVNKEEGAYQKVKMQYNAIIAKLDNGDWKYFAQAKKEEIEKKIEEAEKQKEQLIDKMEIQKIEDSLEQLKIQKQILDWRLEKDIVYGQGELDIALKQYERYEEMVKEYEKNPSQEHGAQVQYQSNLERASIAKYKIENRLEISNIDSRGMVVEFFSQYGMFIVAILVMIAGTILSDEFNKGTIKLLLVKPYQRWKILMAKFITCLITMVIVIGVILLMQLVVGSIFYGLDSFKVPAIYYNYTTNQVETMNLFAYFAIQGISRLPNFILVMLIAFMLSSLFTNSALSIIVALLGFISSDIINVMAVEFNLPFMKFFITLNWDLSPYLFGGLPEFPYTDLTFSIIMNAVYLIGMIAVSILVFKKRNIKNI